MEPDDPPLYDGPDPAWAARELRYLLDHGPGPGAWLWLARGAGELGREAPALLRAVCGLLCEEAPRSTPGERCKAVASLPDLNPCLTLLEVR